MASRCPHHIDVVGALLALELTVVLVLLATFSRRGALGGAEGRDLGRSLPSRDLPDNTCEALDREPPFLPLTARLACPIECSKTCIDSTLVGLGSEFVGGAIGSSRSCARVVNRAVLPVV